MRRRQRVHAGLSRPGGTCVQVAGRQALLEVGSELPGHGAEHPAERVARLPRALQRGRRRGAGAVHPLRHGGARGHRGAQPGGRPQGSARPRRGDLQGQAELVRVAPMSISTAELRAKTALGPKRTGPLVGLARMLGPDYRLGYLFILPTVVLVLALVAYPFCYAIYLSMTRKYVGVPPVFVGFENYVRLAYDGFFRRAVWNSFVFTFASVGFKLVLGMVMALVLTSRIRYRNLFTGLLLIPWVAPTVVSALNFLWIFDASLGVLNYLLVKVFR